MKTIEGKYTYRADIDALRGIAVLLVVLFHAFPLVFPGGFIGVDVFFIISGYLITQIIVKELETERFSITNFYARRIKRLLPALCSVVSFSLIIGWLILYPDEYKKLGYHAYRSLLFTQNLNLIGESGYFDISSHYKPLLHLWSLSVEEQFYLVWPLILYICIKLGQKSLVFVCIIFLISFYLNIHFINLTPTKTFYHIYYRFWELGMGCLLALSYHYLSFNRFNGVYCKSFGFLGVLFIVCSAFIFNEKLKYPSWYALVPTIGAILFIHARFSFTKWYGLKLLGLLSYPLYLWHWVVLSFLHIYFSKQLTNSIISVGLILSLVMSLLTFKYIEKFRYSINKYVVH